MELPCLIKQGLAAHGVSKPIEQLGSDVLPQVASPDLLLYDPGDPPPFLTEVTCCMERKMADRGVLAGPDVCILVPVCTRGTEEDTKFTAQILAVWHCVVHLAALPRRRSSLSEKHS